MGRLTVVGPGLVFAATAVGVSHLVQSTRAGAEAGLGLVGLVVLGHALKYPVFRFGAHYAAARRASLLEGYRQVGRWALVLYGVVTLGTMFTVLAAVTLVTVGLLLALFDTRADPVVLSAILLSLLSVALAVGRYRWLDRASRLLMLVLTLSTLTAAALTWPKVDVGTLGLGLDALVDPARLGFAVALVGWMPSAPDVSVWQSLWVRAQALERPEPPTVAQVSFDFHVGYLATLVLALAFVVLGAGLVHGQSASLPASAGGFARGLVDLYAETLGPWSRPLIGVAALATMGSTTLAVLDGFPRALSGLWLRLSGPEDTELEETTGAGLRAYWLALLVLALGSLLIIALFLGSLPALVDVATSLSFLTAPVLAALNHRAVFGLPAADQPARWLWWSSLTCIVLQAVFALWFLSNRP